MQGLAVRQGITEYEGTLLFYQTSSRISSSYRISSVSILLLMQCRNHYDHYDYHHPGFGMMDGESWFVVSSPCDRFQRRIPKGNMQSNQLK